MDTSNWERVLEELRVPFSAEIVSWKPQTISRDRRRCLAVPYVETQPYQERLDRVCPDWQDDYAIWFSDPQEGASRGAEKRVIPGKVFVKCRLTIGEHTRADVGECELTDENALTTAKAQAFKRTCAAFGLGRYLYNLPKAWVDYDEDKGIPDNEIKRLEWALRRYAEGHVNGNGNGHSNGNGNRTPAPAVEPATAAPDAHSVPISDAEKQPAVQASRTQRSRPANGAATSGAQTAVKNVSVREAVATATAQPAPNGSGDAAPTSMREAVRSYWMKANVTPTTETTEQSAQAVAVAEAPAAEPDQGAASTEHAAAADSICPLHNVPLQLVITREGKTLLLHKIEGEGYCNGEVVRPARA